MNKSKFCFLIILLFSCMNNSIAKLDNKYYVLDDRINIYNNYNDKNTIIGKLFFLDKIIILNNKKFNNKVKIKTNSKIEGWVEYDLISAIPKSWKKTELLNDIIMYLPNKFIFVKGNRLVGLKNNKGYEHKLYDNNFHITINQYLSNYDKFIDNYINEKKIFYRNYLQIDLKNFKIKNENFNGIFFSGVTLMNGKKNYNLIVKNKNNTVYIMTIRSVNIKFDIEQDLIAKKILFSLRFR